MPRARGPGSAFHMQELQRDLQGFDPRRGSHSGSASAERGRDLESQEHRRGASLPSQRNVPGFQRIEERGDRGDYAGDRCRRRESR